MSYWDNYQSRVLKGATTSKERITNDLEQTFEKYLNQSPTCIEVPISMPNQFPDLTELSKELVSINDISNNDKKSLDEKKLLTRNSLDIDLGCYLYYDHSWWLVIFKESKTINSYKKYIIRRCNQIIKYKYRGKIYDIPVSILNMTLYADGLQNNVYTSRQDAKRDVWYGSNEITNSIDIKTRLMLTRKTVFEVTHVNDFEYPGLIKVLVNQVESFDTDDKDNNVAWNPDDKDNSFETTHKIQGNKFIYQGGKNTYKIDGLSTIEWLLKESSEYVTLINNSDGTCTIQASSLSQSIGTKVILIARDKSSSVVVDSLTITIRG